MLAACGGGDAPSRAAGGPRNPSPPQASSAEGNHQHGKEGGDECRPSGAALSISANNVKFNKDCLAAPAGRTFSIKFENMEAVQHNVAILPEHNAPKRLYQGEIFSGPATRTYEVPALEAGTYHFHCDVHPEMQGDFFVQ